MNLGEIHKRCKEIYRREFYNESPDGSISLDVDYSWPTNACKVFDKLTDDTGIGENCLGENFNQLIQNINDEWFSNYTPNYNLSFYFMNYFLLLYLFVERVDLIFEVINPESKSKLFRDFQHNNFKTLRKINKWANFIKHPKEFLFTHWPKYFIEGSPDFEIQETDVKIDTNFIFNHYFSSSKPPPIILTNNQRVFVEIPNLEKITEDFCKEMNLFFEFICNNDIVADFLRKKSTIEDYYFELNELVNDDLAGKEEE
ncbi:MAG TPA: hypothetical protein PKW08_13200 [Flavobacteriaceae bacterium]|nr:hypothetical protein [Flavobacteriaceae bacterium]MCB9213264.1 hypothetical protein [Alteromonas sp.]HPF12384.1 hypothetical protein [Flavobacteriaceae bacterium]HQU22539.1 hypothetical protein [Flavobacteriaceae bacterium]HQU66240.1 hypothetical protein [Flavobacteriaceae bacterium]